jgi:hypothetical protein
MISENGKDLFLGFWLEEPSPTIKEAWFAHHLAPKCQVCSVQKLKHVKVLL